MINHATRSFRCKGLATTSAAALVLGISGLSPQIAAAQEPVAEDRVVVTGSRIQRRDFEANSPIVTVEQERFQNQSGVGVENVLNQMPQFQPVTGDTQFSAGDIQPNAENTVGASLLNMRGLGSNRSLVLLNGRRAQPVNATLAVDVNTIPSAAIRNVEVITGGASSVYGADAVAGVVNFILRDDFEGFSLDGQYGFTEHGGGEEFKISGLFGATLDSGRGHVMLGLEHATRAAIHTRDREFYRAEWKDPTGSAPPLYNARWAPNYTSGNVASQAAIDAVFGAGTPLRVSDNPDFYINYDDQSVFAEQYGGLRFNGDVNSDEYKVLNTGILAQNWTRGYLSLPLERYAAFSYGEYEVNENLNFFGQLTFTEARTATVAAYSPATSNWAVEIPYGNEIYAPSRMANGSTNPNYVAGGAFGLNCPAMGGCTESQAFPVPAELAALLDSRPSPNASWVLEDDLDWFGARETHNQSYTYQTLFGVNGAMGFRDWTYEAYVSHGRTNSISLLDRGFASGARYQAIITSPNFGRGGSYSDTGGFSATCASGIPVFGGALSEDCYDAIHVTMKNTTDLLQNIAEANFQGSVFELPAGELRAAVGASYRENEMTFSPATSNEINSFVDNVIGLFAASATEGYTSVKEVYGELLVPVVSDLPFVQQFDLELGYRYSDYNTAGGVDTYKALGDWQVNDFLRFRGGYQVASRAPNIAELFQPQTVSVVTFAPADPCNVTTLAPWGNVPSNPDRAQVQALCSAIINRNEPPGTADSDFDLNPDNYTQGNRGFFPVERALQMGNPDLEPEKAETWTIGAVFRSPFDSPYLSNLSLSVDWYSIEVSDAIRPLDAVTVYAQCFNADGESNPTYSANDPGGFCAMIDRYADTGGRAQVETPFYNLGLISTSGIDAQVNWSVELGDTALPGSGSIFASINLNWLDYYRTQDLPDAPLIDSKGTLDQGGQFAYRLSADFGYANGPATVGVRWRHLPSIEHEDFAANPDTTYMGAGDYNIFDLYARYDVTEWLSMRAGIDNLFDRQPEVVGRNTDPNSYLLALGQTNAGFYDPIGRRFFMGATADF